MLAASETSLAELQELVFDDSPFLDLSEAR
jgi:hypothetical protein